MISLMGWPHTSFFMSWRVIPALIIRQPTGSARFSSFMRQADTTDDVLLP
jgi:hypothetical protein